MPPRTALIVGAGIGGLAAGIALDRAGWRVRIFERAGSPRELGFALNLAPNAVAALRELGVEARPLAEGHAPQVIEVRGPQGRVLKRVRLSRWARAGGVIALRPVLHGTLLDATPPGSLVLGSEAIGFESDGDTVVLRLSDGRAETGDILVGADGVGSIVRKALHPDEPPPLPIRYLAVRGVAQQVEHHLGDLSVVMYFAPGLEAATAKAGLQSVYWYMSVLADDVPVEQRLVAAIVDRYAAHLDDAFRTIVQATGRDAVRIDELGDRDPIDEWGRGVVTLLGDAAHPMLPHAGQGAAQALEDAVALGVALRRPGRVTDALREYERVRSKRTRRIVRAARLAARIMTTRSAVMAGVRTTALRLMPGHRRSPRS